MQLGKVVGTVVSSQKDEKLKSLALFIVQYIDTFGKATGNLVVAADSVGVGTGEVVLVASGSSARQTDITQGKPVDAVIMAIVDVLEVDGEQRYVK